MNKGPVTEIYFAFARVDTCWVGVGCMHSALQSGDNHVFPCNWTDGNFNVTLLKNNRIWRHRKGRPGRVLPSWYVDFWLQSCVWQRCHSWWCSVKICDGLQVDIYIHNVIYICSYVLRYTLTRSDNAVGIRSVMNMINDINLRRANAHVVLCSSKVRVGNIERHLGYIIYHVAGFWEDPAVRLGIILGCCLFLVIVLVFIFIICNWRHGWVSCPHLDDKKHGGAHETVGLTDMVDGGECWILRPPYHPALGL